MNVSRSLVGTSKLINLFVKLQTIITQLIVIFIYMQQAISTLATKLEQIAQPIEHDHELVWLSLDDCLSQLHLDHQAWAVGKVTHLL